MVAPPVTISSGFPSRRRALRRTRAAISIGAPLLAFAIACSSSGPVSGPSGTTIARPRPTTTAIPLPSAGQQPAPSSSEQPSSVQPPASSAVDSTTGETAAAELRVGTVTTDLQVPWGLGFLPDGTALVTGRDDGTIRAIAPGAASPATTIGTIDDVAHGGEGGLLGLAVSPGFADDGLLYLYYTAEADNRIATVVLRDGALTDQTVILDGIPKGGIHNGGRMTFGPDGLLYVGTGESGDRPIAQDLGSLGGKILRLSPDGSPAPGNPFPDSPYVYTYGHRNVQGLAFDDSGRLWASEFGQNTWDELNLITAGGNYGWPDVEGQVARDGFIEPERVWPTQDASPSGIAFWQGSIWMAGLRGERLWQIPLTDSATDPTGEPIAELTDVYGRLRTTQVAPDGSLWVSTSNTDGRGDVRNGDDRILRLELTG
jgi:glucose/arabinose dehydrogenase